MPTGQQVNHHRLRYNEPMDHQHMIRERAVAQMMQRLPLGTLQGHQQLRSEENLGGMALPLQMLLWGSYLLDRADPDEVAPMVRSREVRQEERC